MTLALALILVPLALALLAFALPAAPHGVARLRPFLPLIGGAVHLGLTLVAVGADAAATPAPEGALLALDPLSRLFLPVVSGLFFLCAVYTPGYLRARQERNDRVFIACLLALLAMMTACIESQHVGLMWVAIEASTLSAAPLIYFNRNARSLEATWKYLLVGSVGIALALLGSFFLAYSGLRAGLTSSLFFSDLVRNAPLLSQPWLHAAFVLLFVGYGSKMGLAPLHNWKPDAYGEAPGVVGALMAGGLTNCAFLAILRFHRICVAAGEAPFAQRIMIPIGLLSMAVAAVFMARQRDYKRMLAYSSVEQMGIMVLGVGLGGIAIFGALLHMVNNALTKAVTFLAAGNMHRAFGSKSTDEVRGALRRLPISGALFLLGFLAITGSPPFGPFWSELTILRGAFAGGEYTAGTLYLVFLAVIFLGMGATVLAVVQGEPPAHEAAVEVSGGFFRESFLTVAPPLVSLALVVLLGVAIPEPIEALIRSAANSLGAVP